MVDVVIVGSVALDTVRTPFGKAEAVLGGAATYAGFAASFFSKPGIVAVVGSDFPQQHLQLLKSRGIDLKGVRVEGSTFRWEGYYEYDMNEAKTVKTELGSFADFKPQLPEEYKEAEYVFLANIDPELQLTVLNQIKKPKLTVMDTMNGDSFAGAFIGCIAKSKDASERSIRKAIIYGSSVASFNAEGFSLDRLKQITASDIEARYREFGRMREF
ncbi:hypothetical protein HYU15_01715 [Candidatus Woesearchaeota archaeon]|nr:hypothetical protein [Candidatus Woesearchaeota archaeon]